jgi:predicted membrane metal-binding protein
MPNTITVQMRKSRWLALMSIFQRISVCSGTRPAMPLNERQASLLWSFWPLFTPPVFIISPKTHWPSADPVILIFWIKCRSYVASDEILWDDCVSEGMRKDTVLNCLIRCPCIGLGLCVTKRKYSQDCWYLVSVWRAPTECDPDMLKCCYSVNPLLLESVCTPSLLISVTTPLRDSATHHLTK